jgi:hypothetical protein
LLHKVVVVPLSVSVKVTVPVAMSGDTDAVKVMLVPSCWLLALEVTVVVV